PISYYRVRPPPMSTLFPYTTLFRSDDAGELFDRHADRALMARAVFEQQPGRVLVALAAGDLERGDDLLQRLVKAPAQMAADVERSEEHTSELQSLAYLVCRLLLEKK